jgi:hypothetical protein
LRANYPQLSDEALLAVLAGQPSYMARSQLIWRDDGLDGAIASLFGTIATFMARIVKLYDAIPNTVWRDFHYYGAIVPYMARSTHLRRH